MIHCVRLLTRAHGATNNQYTKTPCISEFVFRDTEFVLRHEKTPSRVKKTREEKAAKKQRGHKNRFWHCLWGRLFGHRAGFGRFSGPGRVPKMSQNPKKSIQQVALLSLQKTKRMNFSVEVPPGAILRPSWEGPGSILGLILAIFVGFLDTF